MINANLNFEFEDDVFGSGSFNVGYNFDENDFDDDEDDEFDDEDDDYCDDEEDDEW